MAHSPPDVEPERAGDLTEKTMPRTAATFVLIMFTAGCAQNPAPEAFPQDVADTWVERFAAHDAAGLAALYTEDAQLLPPDTEIVSGRAAIQEFAAKNNPPGGPAFEFATVETRVFGEYAHRQGSFRVKGPDAATLRGGKFIELWKKADGHWLIHRDIWNTDTPVPAVTAAKPDEPA